jgi:hypothetical protein
VLETIEQPALNNRLQALSARYIARCLVITCIQTFCVPSQKNLTVEHLQFTVEHEQNPNASLVHRASSKMRTLQKKNA